MSVDFGQDSSEEEIIICDRKHSNKLLKVPVALSIIPQLVPRHKGAQDGRFH